MNSNDNNKDQTINNQNVTISNLEKEIASLKNKIVEQENLAVIGELLSGVVYEIEKPLSLLVVEAAKIYELNIEFSKKLAEFKNILGTENTLLIAKLLNELDLSVKMLKDKSHDVNKTVRNILIHTLTKKDKKFELVQLNNFIDNHVKLAYFSSKSTNQQFTLQFNTNYDLAIDEVEIVAHEFGVVILNIVNNACYAMNEKMKIMKNYAPELTIATKREDENAIIKIKDNGPGMPQHIIKKIFKPFFSTKPGNKSTGLGLSASFDIVTNIHKGTIDVNSKHGDFTEFEITIPMKQSNK